MHEYMWGFLTVLAVLGILIIGRVFYRLLIRRLFPTLSSPWNVALIVAATYLVCHMQPRIQNWLQSRILGNNINQDPITALRVLNAVLIFGAIYFVLRALEAILIGKLMAEERRTKIPALVRNMIMWVLYAIAFMGVLNFYLQIPITVFLVSSGIAVGIIGFALQETLGNFFSGLSISAERPFEIGDWVTVAGLDGRVVEINWRATKIRTRENDLVIVPNAKIASSEIINYYRPGRVHVRRLNVGISYVVPPNKVKEVLREAALRCPKVARQPPPEILFTGYGDNALQFQVRIWIADYEFWPQIESEVYTYFWYALRRNRIEIPYPIRTVHLHSIPEADAVAERDRQVARVVPVLKEIDVFQPLREQELTQLAGEMATMEFAAKEKICQEGDPGDSFYIIDRGRVEVRKRDSMGRDSRLAVLERGKYFGEMSLLTGEKRSATVETLEDTAVLILDKENFRKVLLANEQIAENLSRVLAQRQSDTVSKMAELSASRSAAGVEEERSSSAFLKRIREFFAL